MEVSPRHRRSSKKGRLSKDGHSEDDDRKRSDRGREALSVTD